jgi:hypothetical protein
VLAGRRRCSCCGPPPNFTTPIRRPMRLFWRR